MNSQQELEILFHKKVECTIVELNAGNSGVS